MGFMAGFGSAFAQSFNQGRADSAQKDRDMFRAKFDSLKEMREERAKANKQTSQNVAAAKQLAKQYAGNESLWGEGYKMLSTGQSSDEVAKWFQENEAVVKPTSTTTGDTSGMADPRDALPEKAAGSVDAQMKSSGMATPQPGQGLFAGGKGLFGGREGRVDRDLSEVTGMPIDEINSTLSGETAQADPIPGMPDLEVQWKKKITPETVFQQKRLELEQRRLDLATREQAFQEEQFKNPRMSPADQAKIDLDRQKFEVEKVGIGFENQKLQLELEALQNPKMTPMQQADYDLRVAQFKFEQTKYLDSQAAEANKLTPVSEGTALTDNKGKVVYKNEKPVDDSWMKPKNAEEAAINLTAAEREGNPEKIDIARKNLEAIQAQDLIQAGNTARAKGEAYDSQMAFKTDGKGYATRQNGTWVDSVTKKPLGEGDVRPFGINDDKALDEIAKTVGPVRKEYLEKVSNFTSATRDIDDMEKIIAENPGVTTWAGSLATSIDNTIKNVGATVDLFKNSAQEIYDADGFIKPEYMKTLNSYEDEISNKLNGAAGKGFVQNTERMAAARSLLEIKNIKLAYAKAASAGQTGAGVAAKEFDRFYKSGIIPNAEALSKENKDFRLNEYKKLKELKRNSDLSNPLLEKWRMINGIDSPIGALPDLDQMLGDTLEVLKKDQHDVEQADPNTSNLNQMNGAKGDIPEGYTPTGKFTTTGKPLYRNKDGVEGTLD